MGHLLEIHVLTKTFGGLTAVDRLSLEVEEKSVVGLIGPNGAGKTTLINLISGIYKPDSGEIYFNNKRIDGLPPHEIVRKGIGRTFQIIRVFRNLTVMESLITSGLYLYKNDYELRKKCLELLRFIGLEKLVDEYAKNLSAGQQKLLDIARALILNPRLIMLDEPFHGVHPALKAKICENILLLNKEQNNTFIIVSHDLPSIVRTCRRVIVLANGSLIADGAPNEVREDKKVIDVYIGV